MEHDTKYSAKKQKKIEDALKEYKKGEITIGRAAELSGVDLRTMIALAAKKGIPFQYSKEDLEEDFRAIDDEIKEKDIKFTREEAVKDELYD